jgi:hypothetical protein
MTFIEGILKEQGGKLGINPKKLKKISGQGSKISRKSRKIPLAASRFSEISWIYCSLVL